MLGKTNEEALERLNAPQYQNTPCRLLIMHGPRDRSVAKDDVDPSLDEIFPKNLSNFTYYTPAAILGLVLIYFRKSRFKSLRPYPSWNMRGYCGCRDEKALTRDRKRKWDELFLRISFNCPFTSNIFIINLQQIYSFNTESLFLQFIFVPYSICKKNAYRESIISHNMLIAYSPRVVFFTRAYFLALLITILSKIEMGITKFSYHPPAMVTGAWIFYETAVFKKSRVRMEVYLKNTIHGFIALVALAISCFGYWVSLFNK
jgi:hypothetical protein